MWTMGGVMSPGSDVTRDRKCYDRTTCTIRLDLQRLVTRLYLDGLILGAM